MLHVGDQARSQDLDFSLKCLWCKALSGLDPNSPAYDDGVAYDMLPSISRTLLLPYPLYPRLIHFNIELRTVYLDRAIREEISLVHNNNNDNKSKNSNIRLITLGAGYDTRSVRFLEEGLVQQAWEFDVLPVIQSKQVMLDRLAMRRQSSHSSTSSTSSTSNKRRQQQQPKLVVQDLNDLSSFAETLKATIYSNNDDDDDNDSWHNILVLEGVLIYLNDGIPASLLTLCSDQLLLQDKGGSLVFADLFRSLSSLDIAEAETFFRSMGWELVPSSWCPKPGLAKHMGVARLL